MFYTNITRHYPILNDMGYLKAEAESLSSTTEIPANKDEVRLR